MYMATIDLHNPGISYPQTVTDSCVEVYAGDDWTVCPECGDLNELSAAFWNAVALAGCQEAPVRCHSCGHLYSVAICDQASQ